MSDIDRLTVVVAISMLLLTGKLPERDYSTWGFAHLTFNMLMSFIATLVLSIMIVRALHWA